MKPKGRILFAGQAYYNAWYLSRALRKLGWRADVLNWDSDPASQMYYHGEDFKFQYRSVLDVIPQVYFYFKSLFEYDIFHFSNAHGMRFGPYLSGVVRVAGLPKYSEIRLLKKLGKKIVYSNNGCIDGVSQTSFREWGPVTVCDECPWRDRPDICSDERNLAWGKARNELADYQCTVGGNRKDYNDDPSVHEVPEFYCLDPDLWRPDLEIPDRSRLDYPAGTVKLYHGVGNFDGRTSEQGQNLKSTHIYRPLIERLRAEGHPVELMFFSKVPNIEVRFYQAQADIVLEMLTFGFFGANVREAMMLGKPVICFLRPEWLESMKREIPDYVDELPVVSATPDTVYEVLKGLIEDPERRRELGARGREFALKYHSAEAAGVRLDRIYSSLLQASR